MKNDIDYKTLLWKYIEHAGIEGGGNYVWLAFNRKGRFTKEELDAIAEIDNMDPPTGKEWEDRY